MSLREDTQYFDLLYARVEASGPWLYLCLRQKRFVGLGDVVSNTQLVHLLVVELQAVEVVILLLVLVLTLVFLETFLDRICTNKQLEKL